MSEINLDDIYVKRLNTLVDIVVKLLYKAKTHRANENIIRYKRTTLLTNQIKKSLERFIQIEEPKNVRKIIVNGVEIKYVKNIVNDYYIDIFNNRVINEVEFIYTPDHLVYGHFASLRNKICKVVGFDRGKKPFQLRCDSTIGGNICIFIQGYMPFWTRKECLK